MIQKYGRLVTVVLLLGWVFDFLFWEIPVGVNFAVFTSLCLLGGFLVLLDNGIRPAAKSLLLLIPILFFLGVTFLRQERLTIGLAYVFVFLSTGLLVFSYRGGRWLEYNLVDYIKKLVSLLGSVFSAPIKLLKQFKIEENILESQTKIPFRSVVRGGLIAIPVLAIFTFLLSAADVVFEQKTIDFLEEFSGEALIENISRLGLILWTAYWMLGMILHAAWKSKDLRLDGEGEGDKKISLGYIEAVIVLGSVTVLFAIFVLIQFQYFFGGEVNIGVDGYSYSEYARRGFNELILVAFFSLVMILVLNKITRRETKIERRIYSGLGSGIVMLVLVILVSAYQRLMLGIDWHGYSRLRLYPSIFLIWLGLLLVVVIGLEIFQREKYSTLAGLLVSYGFGVSLVFFNVDASIVHHNVLRPAKEKHFNVTHLTTLSLDAVPALAEEFLNAELSDSTREGIGAALMCYKYSDALEEYDPTEWKSFNDATRRAVEALEQVKEEMDGYQINADKIPRRVLSPNSEKYKCGQ
jgi:hypothetical protein